jgi:hypothetical protein
MMEAISMHIEYVVRTMLRYTIRMMDRSTKRDIVALSGNGVSQVEKTSSPYDAKAI